MNRRVTQADVARRAGVHSTTVSLALRNHPSIPPETRTRLRQLAEQMGYRPDPDLSALMAYRRGIRVQKASATLGYLTNAGSRWGWKKAVAHAQFFAGASSRADQLGYRLEHFWMGEAGLSSARMNDIFVSRGISGLVLASHWEELRSPLLDWSRFCAVKIDFLPQTPTLHNVTNDQRAIVQLAMRKAIASGYRRIGLVIPWWWDEYVDLAWSAGFLAEQNRVARKEQVPILFFGSTLAVAPNPDRVKFDVPRDELETWLRRFEPDVIISYGPFVTGRLKEMGLRVPSDLAFVDLFLEEFDGRTAGVRSNCGRVGELAVEILAGQLQQHNYGLPAFPTTTLVEGTWVDGASLPPRG